MLLSNTLSTATSLVSMLQIEHTGDGDLTQSGISTRAELSTADAKMVSRSIHCAMLADDLSAEHTEAVSSVKVFRANLAAIAFLKSVTAQDRNVSYTILALTRIIRLVHAERVRTA